MAELRINTTGKLSLFDADDSHAASIIAGTVSANENVMSLATAGVTFNVPTITLGDATAEDTKIVFDGNAQDFYIALDDSADDLLIGLGSTVGTTPMLSFGANGSATFKNVGTGDDNPMVLTLQTAEADMAANDVIGKLAFQAPDEGTGTDAILISAAIQARAEGDHSSSSNATSIDFMTGASEAAATKWSITSAGKFLNAGTNALDMNAGELILDADADTSLTADTDDQIDVRIAGADDIKITANKFELLTGTALDMDGLSTTVAAGDIIVSAGKVANQSVANATTTKAAIATVVIDRGSDFDTSNNRFVAPKAGSYWISTGSRFTTTACNRLIAIITKNQSDIGGTVGTMTQEIAATANTYTTVMSHALVDLAVDDYIELLLYQDSGSSINFFQSNMFVYRVGTSS